MSDRFHRDKLGGIDIGERSFLENEFQRHVSDDW
jgi:hypothetical protein